MTLMPAIVIAEVPIGSAISAMWAKAVMTISLTWLPMWRRLQLTSTRWTRRRQFTRPWSTKDYRLASIWWIQLMWATISNRVLAQVDFDIC